MREVLFRGKSKRGWVEGFFFYLGGDGGGNVPCIGTDGLSANDYSEIFHWDYEKVDPSTIGQYTGLMDKNGNRIFEGDIIRTSYPDCTAIVSWDAGCARFIGFTRESERRIVYVDRVGKDNRSAVEVIGNIYE